MMGFFFQRPHSLWEVLTFAFLTQFDVYKMLLMSRLVPYQKFLNIKAIKCMVTKPQFSKLLIVQDQPI